MFPRRRIRKDTEGQVGRTFEVFVFTHILLHMLSAIDIATQLLSVANKAWFTFVIRIGDFLLVYVNDYEQTNVWQKYYTALVKIIKIYGIH